MSTKLYLISVLAASLTLHGAAMPTEAEVEKAVPKVERMLASEKVALASGKMTRAEVATTAMKLAAGADDEAAKLLLMKGAFILHVKDGDLEKAVKTMNALETAISDMPPQIVTNIIETALLGLPNKGANGTRLYQLLDAMKVAGKSAVADGENRKAVVGGYTWTYRVKNGEAEIVAEKDGKFTCAVSANPTGSISIPSTLDGAKVTSIGKEAFRGCKGLSSVIIPSSVTNVGWGAFWDCCELKSVAIPSAVRRLDSNVFRRCRRLTSVVIPSNVTSIGWCAFCDCSGLRSVTIPLTVSSIGGCAFFRCGELASVTIPRNVTSIGKDAFYGCGYLSSVTMLGGHPNSPDNVFPKCANLKEIRVPANAKSWAGMKEWQGIPLVFDAK